MVIETLVTTGVIGATITACYFIGRRVHGMLLQNREIDLGRIHDDNITEINREHYFDLENKKKGIIQMMREKSAKSLKRSKEVLRGQSYEQITPYLEEFKYYPGDCHFLGKPIDLVVFDGAVRDDIQKIVLVEIKTGKSRLSKRQKQIKEVVERGDVEFLEYRIPTEPIILKHKEDLAEIDECLCNKCVYPNEE